LNIEFSFFACYDHELILKYNKYIWLRGKLRDFCSGNCLLTPYEMRCMDKAWFSRIRIRRKEEKIKLRTINENNIKTFLLGKN
jgi:hypothetical protein